MAIKPKTGTKFLNVDALAPVGKSIKLNGAEHQMKQVSVREFIDLTRGAALSEEEEFANLPVDQKVAKMLENVSKSFPTAPVELLEALTLDQLMAIVRYVSETLEADAEASVEKNA